MTFKSLLVILLIFFIAPGSVTFASNRKEIGRIIMWWQELLETIRTPEMQNKKQSILYFSIRRLFSRLHSSSGHEGNIRGVMQTRDLIYGLHRVKLVSAWLVVRICEANIELLIRSDERLMVETSVFDSLNGGQLHYLCVTDCNWLLPLSTLTWAAAGAVDFSRLRNGSCRGFCGVI